MLSTVSLNRVCLASLWLGTLLCLATGCRSAPPPKIVRPVPAAASAALEEARMWQRQKGPEARESAREAAIRARDLAPDWVAPERLLDDLARADLLGIEALAQHRLGLAAQPFDAAQNYLAGRLEGRQGERRFERATTLDPTLAWGYHGLAWQAAQAGDHRLALRYAQRALERARDPFERSYFTAALARFHMAADQPRRAIAVLLERLGDSDLGRVDRLELSVRTAAIEMSMLFQLEARRGAERALQLLRTEDLTDDEVEELVPMLRLSRPADGAGSLELQLALAAKKSPARDRWRAELMLEHRPTPLALGLLRRSREQSGRPPTRGPLMRAARFAAGQFELGVEEWLADMPRALLDGDGSPRDADLRNVVASARLLSPEVVAAASTPGSGVVEALARFGDQLVRAGWFREARAVAAALAVHDLDRALALEDRAAAGQDLLHGLRQSLQSTDDRLVRLALGGEAPKRLTLDVNSVSKAGSGHARGLREMLASMAPVVARSAPLLGGEGDPKRVQQALRESPLQEYGGFGALVHPGPTFSAADQRAGLGRAGDPVPGLAQVLARVGRFGVFGEMSGGGGPDGTILQRVLIEERSGEHLSVPWSGTVAWCEGADLQSRAGRLGASISGAALHEGYWVDIDAVRRERDQWAALQREFEGEQNAARAQRALRSRGLELETPPESREARRAERRSTASLLGESDRMRLAVLRDRAAGGGGAPSRAGASLVTLDELVEITALHEQGHLCDRTRFLPLSKHLLAVARLFLRVGMSPSRIAEQLEYRAQLVALAEATDPRPAWVEILRATETEITGPTPHAGAYRRLLADLLWVLDQELERDPAAWPELDAGHVLAHQLHWLSPEKLRTIARKLAKREGLDQR